MPLPRVLISTDLRLSSEEQDDAQLLIDALLHQHGTGCVREAPRPGPSAR